MEDDDTDDLAALLEKELNELSDDEDAELNIESNILSNIEVAEEDIHIEDELTLLMASANELAGFRNYSQELSPVVLTEETALSDPNIIDNDAEEDTFNHDTTLHHYKLTELTPEEKEIIVELLQLMVESVERCAPIFHESKILVPEEEESHLLKTVAELTMMTEDKETELENLMKPSEDIAPPTDTVGLLDDRITTEAKQRKDANILSTQQNDQFIWDESNKFKQEMEKERARLEERRRKREQARLYAIQEKSMIKIQKIIRGMVTRRYTTDLLRTHREKLANEAIERNLQKQREEEEKLKEELRLQRVQEAVETQRMGVLESESRQCWKEMAEHLERLRQQEIRQFTAEDSLATAIRDVVLQARCRIEAYASLVAQEDVEYDIPGYGSDSDSEEADEEAEKSTAVCANIQNSTNLSAAATIPAQSRDVSNRVEMDEGTGLSLQLHRTTAAPPARKPIHPPPHTPAPRSAKAVMTVDPTQGKKWGGSISTSAWNSPAVPAATVNQAPVAHPQVKSGREAEAMGEPTPILSQEEDVKVQRPLPYSMCELAALETERQQTHLKLPFSAEGVDFARSCMNELFTPSENSHDEEGVCHHIEKSSGELVPAVVSALRCWRDWWVSRSASYSYSHLSMKPATRRPHSASEQKRSTSSSSGGKSRESVVSAKAERENEEALSNSMVDLETDPLLAKELDFCVEGLCSSTFLDKFKNLTKLALNVNKLTELHGVAGLLNLVSISAKDNKIASLSPLRGLQQLKYLHLDSNRIADLSPLSGLTQLTVLCVNSNHISDLPQLHCPSMQRLELSRNKLSSVAADCLSGLPVLNHLNLSSNQISTVCGETLSACGMLQTLLLSENRLEVVPHPLRLPMLKNLRLNLNRLTSLGQWEHNPDVSMPWPMCTPSLQKLVLSDNQIATLPGKIFQTLPLLQELDLSFNALTERDCLLGLASCRLLTALHIQDNIFTTTPVNTPAAGTSRTALAAPQLQQLCQWILSVCPALETVSGNRLDMSLYQEKMESLRSSQILDHYIRTSLWPDQQHCTAGTDVYGHELPLVQELISSLQTHHVCQNMLTVRERAIKKDELAANKYASNSKRININPAETGVNGVKSTLRDWDLELMELLKSQLEQLVSLASPPTLRPNAPTTVFLSFAKEHHIKCSTTASSVALLDAPPARAPDGTLLMAHKLSAQSVATPQLMPDSCVVALQQHFRGRRVRKRVSSALESIRYQDTELDDLFGEDFSLDQDFLDMSFLEEDAPVAMVYGDHIRRRSRPNSSVPMLPTGAEATAGVSYPLPTAATAASSLPGKQHTSQADSATHWVLPADDANSPPKSLSGTTAHTLAPPLDRPLTGMSSVSTLSAQSDAPDNAARSYSNNNSSTPSPAGSRSNLLSARSDGQNSEVISMMTSARRSQRANQAAMAQDWGITDPRVLAQMMKRTQRIQGFVEQKEKKERDKDPQYRLEQFQKSAQRMGGQATFGNTKTSGSFGGAPRTTRAAGGGGKRKQMAVPAWMLGGEGEAKDSNGDS